MRVTVIRAACLTVWAIPVVAFASGAPDAGAQPTPPHYRLIDVGTFGGPHADINGPADQITAKGAVLGIADTTIRDVDSPNDGIGGGDPYIFHAFAFRNGRLTDLGALPGNNSSVVQEMNRAGLGVGGSETGRFDPRAHAPALHPVLFRHGRVVDIGTLPGGSEGFAVTVNSARMVGGVTNTGDPGPGMPEFFDWGSQIRSFVWQHGVMRDLGTLGGPGTLIDTMNERGQISGDSYVSSTPDPHTGLPTLHPFLWQHGHMRDLGTLGGTQTFTRWMNERGHVTGRATLRGDTTSHPFLWDGHRLRDLGTLGGGYGEAAGINDRDEVAGFASPASDDTVHTFLWRHGRMTDLSPGPDRCSYAEWINNRTQVVGVDCADNAAVLWQDGRQYDLNTLVAPNDAHLTAATYITDNGRIAAIGTTRDGDQHVFLLRPIS